MTEFANNPTAAAAQRHRFIEWLLLGGALLVLGGITGYSLVESHREIDRRERERLAAQARVIDANLARQLEAVGRALTGLRIEWLSQRRDATAVARISSQLRAFVDAMPSVRTLAILDADGKVLAANHAQLVGADFRARAYFQAPLKNPDRDTLYIGPPFRTSLGAFAMSASRMIPGANGEFAGVITATLDPEEARILLESVNYADDMLSAIAHGDGLQAMMVPPREGQEGKDLAQPGSVFSRHRDSGRDANVLAGRIHAIGGERMLALRTVQPPALRMDKPLVITVSRDLSALYAPWRANAYVAGGLYGLLALTTIAGLLYYQWRRRTAEEVAARSDARLREKSAELERFFSVALDLLCIADFDGRFRKLNPAWQAVFGYTPAELEGSRFLDLVHPDDVAATEAVVAALAAGQPAATLTNRYRAKAGDYRYIEWSCVPHEGQLIYAAARDVTAARLNQQALADSERFMRSLIDILPGMVGYWTDDLRCSFANRAYLEWFGKRVDEMRGIRIQDLLGEALFRANEPFIRAALRGETQHFERTLVKADGSTGYTWAHYIPDRDDAGRVRGFFVLVSDITELKRAEMALRKERDFVDAVLETAGSLIVVLDSQGRIVRLNRAGEALTGYRLDEVAGRPFWDIFLLDEERAVVTGAFDAIQAGDAVPRLENHWRCKDGSARLLDWFNAVLLDEQGKVEYIVSLGNDITERKQQELQLRQAKTAAEAASRAKGEFVANMSHEIRTPLNAIIGLAGLALRQQVSPKLRDYLDKISVSSKALLSVINDILDYSKIEAGRLELEAREFSLAEVLGNVINLFGVGADEKGLRLDLEIAPDVPARLVGDALRLGQVMSNLVGNAVKFTAAGAVRISVLRLDEASGEASEDATLRFCVSDSGIGISDEQLQGLFQAFTQADGSITRRFGGTGLGLAISQRLVHLMGGEIVASSVPGQGSEFSFSVRFAVADGTDAASAAGGPAAVDDEWLAAPAAIRGARILLVEDNAINQQVAREVLEQAGFAVVVAGDGQQALAALAGESFDAVLMDLQMPVMDGLTATRRIRADERLRDLPIIAMTAAATGSDEADCLAAGMNDHVAKPILPGQLMRTLAKWIAPGARPQPAERAAADAAPLPPRLPGLDIGAAARRLGGDYALLEALLGDFAAQFADFDAALERLLDAGQVDDARRRVHELRGVAGNIGAMDVHRLAGALEEQLAQRQAPTARAALFAALGTALASIAGLPAAAPVADDCGNCDWTRAAALLRLLRQRLGDSDFVSHDLLVELGRTAMCRALRDCVARLSRQIASFDYVGAREELDRFNCADGHRIGN